MNTLHVVDVPNVGIRGKPDGQVERILLRKRGRIEQAHFLGHGATLSRMETDYVYPALGDRSTPQEWADSGAPDLLERARLRTAEMLAAPAPAHISPDVDAEIRTRWPIHLPER